MDLEVIANNYDTDNQSLLSTFHKHGINKCDKFILENSSLKGNWYYVVDIYPDNINSKIREASITQITGSLNDTIKLKHTYIQTPTACYLETMDTITFSGPCSANINLDNWYISKEIKWGDYTEYKNKGGVILYAKEITVGNFKACLKEFHARRKYKLQ